MGVLSKKIIFNSLWMVLEKIVAIFGLIFVTSLVAKYIGPENFGKLTFAGSLFALLQTFAMLGSENIIFQKTTKNRKIGERIILSTKIIRDTVYILSSMLLLGYLYFNVDYLTFVFSIASCIAIYFALHDVYSIYFNAILSSKINAICNVFALLISLLIRYFIVRFELAIEWLALPIVLVSFIPYFARKVIFEKSTQIDKKNRRYYSVYRRYMINMGGKLVLYTLSVAIFTKTSQLFLGMKSQYDLGIYTVAATLGTSYYFVLSALISSMMTQVYIEQSYEKSQKMVAQINAIVLIVSLLVLLFFWLFGEWIVNFLYGEAFNKAVDILLLMVVVCFFSGLSTVAEKYLIKFSAYSYLQKKTNILVVFNIIITACAVYFYGLIGAVFAILLTEFVSTTILNYFYRSHTKIVILDTQKQVFSLKTYLR